MHSITSAWTIQVYYHKTFDIECLRHDVGGQATDADRKRNKTKLKEILRRIKSG